MAIATVALNMDGQICRIPIDDLQNPRRMQWWATITIPGDDPFVESFVRRGCKHYFHKQEPSAWDNILIWYKTKKQKYLWDHPYATARVYRIYSRRNQIRNWCNGLKERYW